MITNETEEFLKIGTVIVGVQMPSLRKAIKGMLRQYGDHTILEAGSGEEVLRTLRSGELEGDLFVIMDWDMLNISGVDVAREIRGDKRLEDTPILLLASEFTEEQIGMAGEVGVNGCLIKPFPASMLIDRVSKIVRTRNHPPEHVKLIKLGQSLIENGEYDEAMNFFRKSLNIKKSARVLVHIGETYEKKEEYNEADHTYREAMELNPQYLKAYVMASELLIKLGSPREALMFLEKATAISPYNAERQMMLGNLYMNNKEPDKAAKAFMSAVRIESDRGVEVGEKLMALGRSKDAESCFRSALKNKWDEIHIYNKLGIALRKQGKWQEAIDEYKKALQQDSFDEVVHFNMGKAYLEGGRTTEARDCFKKALDINPNLQQAEDELKKMGLVGIRG